MKIKRLAVVLMVFGVFASLFGCKNKHILDGPGMVNDTPWKAFTLSRSDSFADYNFWFTVEYADFAYRLTGECRDERGEYLIEDGVELSGEDVRYLRELWLGDLKDVKPSEETGDLEILDAPIVTFMLTWLDGTEQEKAFPDELSIEVYTRFLPYFTT